MSSPETVLVGRRVLFIEDEDLLTTELMDKLDEVGAISIGPIMTVATVLHAVRTYQEIDAILMNVILRGETTFPVAGALIEREMPFLFVTGNYGIARERYPATPCHPKPIDKPLLIATLARLVQKANQGKASSETR